MASGSAFQYSTLATLGHPSLLCPPSPSPCSSVYPRSLSPSRARASSFAFSPSISLYPLLLLSLPSVSSMRLFPLSRSLSSFYAAISSLSDRSSASSFGLRVLLFRSSAFLSFRSLAGSSDGLSSLRRHCGRIHSANFIERIFSSLSTLSPFSFSRISRASSTDLSILRLLFD